MAFGFVDFLLVVEKIPASDLIFAPGVDDNAVGNAEKPVAEFAFFLVARQGFQDSQEGILEEVFGFVPIAREAKQKGEEGAFVAPYQDFEGRRVAFLELLNEFGIFRGHRSPFYT